MKSFKEFMVEAPLQQTAAPAATPAAKPAAPAQPTAKPAAKQAPAATQQQVASFVQNADANTLKELQTLIQTKMAQLQQPAAKPAAPAAPAQKPVAPAAPATTPAAAPAGVVK